MENAPPSPLIGKLIFMPQIAIDISLFLELLPLLPLLLLLGTTDWPKAFHKHPSDERTSRLVAKLPDCFASTSIVVIHHKQASKLPFHSFNNKQAAASSNIHRDDLRKARKVRESRQLLSNVIAILLY